MMVSAPPEMRPYEPIDSLPVSVSFDCSVSVSLNVGSSVSVSLSESVIVSLELINVPL